MSTKQRGSGWSIKLVITLYHLFGYTFIYYLMYPVTFFYFLVAGNVKAALKDYYAHINKPFNNCIYFTHLRYFAITMCDRFVSRVSPQDYQFLNNNEELLATLKNGSILLMSHFGGWATAGNCFNDFKISIVMHEVLLQEIKHIEEELKSTQTNITIIDMSKGATYVTFEIASALMKNEIVGMMADRASDAKNAQSVNFFGQKAHFNKNPFVLAYKTQKPIICILFVYQGPQCYTIECIKITMDKQKDQTSEIEKAMQSYVDFLASIVSKNPEQWFNFYPFWKEEY